MNEALLDLAVAAPWLSRKPRQAPAAVSVLWCRPTRAGGLMFAWQRPRDRVAIAGYRVERTRDGRDYETLAETRGLGLALPPVALDEPWFYRVSACNGRGQGRARWVFFFLRRRHRPLFLRVPVRPGRRIVINELLPA